MPFPYGFRVVGCKPEVKTCPPTLPTARTGIASPSWELPQSWYTPDALEVGKKATYFGTHSPLLVLHSDINNCEGDTQNWVLLNDSEQSADSESALRRERQVHRHWFERTSQETPVAHRVIGDFDRRTDSGFRFTQLICG